MKKIIRLTESDLHRIIKESVKRIMKEELGGGSPGGGLAGGIGGGGASNCLGTFAPSGNGKEQAKNTQDVPFGGMVSRKTYSPKGDKNSDGMTQVDMKPGYDRTPGFTVKDKATGHKG